MTIEKTEFTFPDESEVKDEKQAPVESADSSIEIVDDTPPEDRGRKPMVDPPKDPTDEELSKYDESVKKRIQHFTKGYHEERRAKEAAQREKEEAIRAAQAIAEENRKLRGSLSQGQTALVEQAKRALNGDIESARRQYKEATEAFDADAQMAAQERLTELKIRAEQLNNFKPAPLQQEETAVQPRQQVTQPKQIDPDLEAWQDRNKWFGANKRMTAYALGLHEELVEEGVKVGSKQYYERLDADLHKRFPDQFEDTQEADAQTQPKANVVAPVTRSTAPRKVVLTQSQVNIAKRLGVPLELYARKVAEEMRNVK